MVDAQELALDPEQLEEEAPGHLVCVVKFPLKFAAIRSACCGDVAAIVKVTFAGPLDRLETPAFHERAASVESRMATRSEATPARVAIASTRA